MNIKKLITVGLAVTVAMLQWVANAEIKVSDVEVFSGYPWKEVVIGYTITGKYRSDQSLRITAKDIETGKTYICAALDGAKTRPQSLEWKWLTEGRHITKWHPAVDGIKLKSSNVVFTVEVRGEPPLYCVIDLSGGAKATKYNVEYFVDAPSDGWTQSGGWTDEYKTTKLVLRRIDAGSFKMQGKYDVSLTKPFYMGVFEVTQKQYELVKGADSKWAGNMRPLALDEFSYMQNPTFLTQLRKKTGRNFDLPTEAQWEYACRAGTTTTYSYGDDKGDKYMWYTSNSQNSSHDVGTRLPNPWGLYDMYGNVFERCFDWYGDTCAGGIDPKGPSSGPGRVIRGGSFLTYAGDSSSRYYDIRSSYGDVGFRISLTIED